ncbi:hypothetical protein C1645_836603 [Glomus cerebriforme]|uniref:Uncharacterized protein n=1 Tax=Glomus cerebriforme TaxID=658196 RepID=A0A397SBL9_9GLOM|nr:hypothetical protein C1645_836603 [Glomus cerebriforme]
MGTEWHFIIYIPDELELLRQCISELEAKNIKLETEKAKLLKQIMEKDAKRDIENTELKFRVRKLEVRLAVLEQGITEVTGQPQNDKEVIAEVQVYLSKCPISTVDVFDSIVDQQNTANTKPKENKKIDDLHKKKVSDEIRQWEKKLQDDLVGPQSFQREPDSETLVASLDSATFLNEKNGQDCSPIANKQVPID